MEELVDNFVYSERMYFVDVCCIEIVESNIAVINSTYIENLSLSVRFDWRGTQFIDSWALVFEWLG